MTTITATNIDKTVGYQKILPAVTFSLNCGELLVVTGPNGSGKSTLLKVLAGLSKPSNGSISGILSRDVGFVGHLPMVYSTLTVMENLVFFAGLYGKKRTDFVTILDQIELSEASHVPGRVLSRGMLQRLAFGRILVQQPRLILLDEPFTGLDPQGQNWLRQFLEQMLLENRAVVVVSHNRQELGSLPYHQLHLPGGTP